MSNLQFELLQVQRFLKTAKNIEQAKQGTQIRKQYLRKWYGRNYASMAACDLCQQLKKIHAEMYVRVLRKGR